MNKLKCEKHPKYKGKSKPKQECVDCLSIYFKIKNLIRMPIKPTKIYKDKSKYSRKNKHKKIEKD